MLQNTRKPSNTRYKEGINRGPDQRLFSVIYLTSIEALTDLSCLSSCLATRPRQAHWNVSAALTNFLNCERALYPRHLACNWVQAMNISLQEKILLQNKLFCLQTNQSWTKNLKQQQQTLISNFLLLGIPSWNWKLIIVHSQIMLKQGSNFSMNIAQSPA